MKQFFAKALAEGFSSQVYLLTGSECIGKRSLVLDVVRDAHKGTEPGITDPYTMVIGPDEKGTISIKEHIRPLQHALALQPPPGVRTFVLIDDIERLSFHASHAVLKMLEEPPAHAIFMLISSAPGELPDTIRSRCLQVRCTPPTSRQVQEFLASRNIAEKHRDVLTALAGGSIGWLVDVVEHKEIAKTVAVAGELEEHMKIGRAERLLWAKSLADRDDVRQIVLRWMHSVRLKLAQHSGNASIARGLLELHETLGHTNYNSRLALEHFVLNI